MTKPSLVVHYHKLQCIVKNCFAVFKVKDTVTAQTFIECLSEQDFLKDLNFCSQTWHSDASS